MAINFTDGSDYVIYQYCGKTYIGKFYTSAPAQVLTASGTHGSLGGSVHFTSDNYYFVENPAELEIELSIPSTGSAELSWKIKPAFYKELVSNTDSNYGSFFFTYPKQMIAISNFGGDIIDSTLLAAYEELCF